MEIRPKPGSFQMGDQKMILHTIPFFENETTPVYRNMTSRKGIPMVCQFYRGSVFTIGTTCLQ